MVVGFYGKGELVSVKRAVGRAGEKGAGGEQRQGVVGRGNRGIAIYFHGDISEGGILNGFLLKIHGFAEIVFNGISKGSYSRSNLS